MRNLNISRQLCSRFQIEIRGNCPNKDPEMEFLDINLTKDSSLMLNDFHSSFYWWILKKTILFSGFKNHYKIIRETRKLESMRRLELMPRNLD
jgi:hypothetical protein